jgi:arsenite methyltransferase
MSATDIPVDVEVLREEIRKTYTDVSTDQEQAFIFPTGRGWAQELGYPAPELARVPDATVESFAGVANHWPLGRVVPGSVVLDLGCGAGTDLLIAAQMTGPTGRVIGVDMTPAMLERASASAQQMGFGNVQLHESADRIAAARGRFGRHRHLQRGDRPRTRQGRVFDEIDRVLRPGGRLQIADIVIHTEVSEDARKRINLWTGRIAGALLSGEHARLLVQRAYTEITQGELTDTYARSAFEDTRRKAVKFGAMGSTIKAYKPKRRDDG